MRRERSKSLSWMVVWTLGSVAIAFLAGSCNTSKVAKGRVPTVDEDGVPLLLHKHFYNYYPRALALAFRERWEEAATDLRKAIGSVPGAVKTDERDRWRARTYGLKFTPQVWVVDGWEIRGYFPHRELGVCLYSMGQFREAEKELRHSLSQTPSSRARQYLKRVRRALLAQETSHGAGPMIAMDWPDGPVVLNNPAVTLRGKIECPNSLDTVSVNGHALFLEDSPESFALKHVVNLSTGKHTLTVTATDLAGRSETWQAECTIDLDGPMVYVTHGSTVGERALRLVVRDDQGLSNVAVNGTQRPVPEGTREFTETIGAGDGTRLRVSAEDGAGNTTAFDEPIQSLLRAALETQRCAVGTMLAAAEGGASPPNAGVVSDTIAPVFELLPDLGEKTVVTVAAYRLDLRLTDSGSGIASLVTGVNAGRQERTFGKPHPTSVRLTEVLPIRPGESAVSIALVDAAGNRSERTLIIHRPTNPFVCDEVRMSTQVVPPWQEKVAGQVGPDLYTTFLGELCKANRVAVVERDPDVVRRLIAEQKISLSNLASVRGAIRSGKMRSAEWLLHSRFTRWPRAGNWEWVLQVVDVETNMVVFPIDMHFQGVDDDVLREGIEGLVGKFTQRLPQIAVGVGSADSSRVLVRAGRDHQLVEGMRFVFMPSESPDDPFPSAICCNGRRVEGKVVGVREGLSKLEIIPEEAWKLIRPEDTSAVLR